MRLFLIVALAILGVAIVSVSRQGASPLDPVAVAVSVPGNWPPAVWDRASEESSLSAAVSDSARDELRVGRAWHAARLLRAAGAETGHASDVLLLASAEAGWKNYDAVIELLANAPWLSTEADGQGHAYLGRAYEDAERWPEAANAYAAYLSSDASARDPFAPAVHARLARAAMRSGDPDAARSHLEQVDPLDGVGSWAAVELMSRPVEEGDTATVTAFFDLITDESARSAVWRAMADARLEAGDSVGALVEFRRIHSAESGARRARAGIEVAQLLLEEGDTASAVELASASIPGAVRLTAARGARLVFRYGQPGGEESLALAAILDRGGDGATALAAYDRAASLAGGAEELSPGDRLSRARLMATVSNRRGDAIEEFRALTDTDDPDLDRRVAARTLNIWSGVRRRQGQSGNADTLRRWLVERYPESPEAVEIVFLRAWDAESEGATTRAVEGYTSVVENAPSLSRGGQARMRLGQIHLARGNTREAALTYEAYLDAFPDGARWEEAAFWAAKARLDSGNEEAARAHVTRLQAEEPFSYYAVKAAEILGEEYRMVPLAEADSVVEPDWLTEGFRRMDLFTAAGLDDAVDAEEERLVALAAGDRVVRLRVAEGLIERGRTIAAINMGWALRREGHAWDDRLVRVVYPFPHREMVRREAAEWGIDPMMMAALIRQESAWEEEIVSSAGAVGLMQVMPPTARELAGRHGPEDFETDGLKTAEVNLHLGAAFLRDMLQRYEDLPLVLSAYNAGPTRANRWRNYPEAGDWLRFTERVPFAETRGYIKNVSRNLGVYRILYGPVM